MNNKVLENVKIGFMNLSGLETPYNRSGNRNFCVFLDTATANDMKSEGWNVKYLKTEDPDEIPQAYIQVTVSYKIRAPKIVAVYPDCKEPLNEDTVCSLDGEDIESADIILNPYEWEFNGNTGIKAYLKTMYVKIEEDVFASKYRTDSNFEDENTPF